jgi:hypothetical protein
MDVSRAEATAAPPSANRRSEAASTYRQDHAPSRPRRRGGFGLIGFVILLIVIFGALMLYLAARNGSFAQGGAVIDHGLSSATQPVRNAEDRAGAALEHAGQGLKRDAGPTPR